MVELLSAPEISIHVGRCSLKDRRLSFKFKRNPPFAPITDLPMLTMPPH